MSDKSSTTAAYSVAEALNLSRDTFYKLVRDGKLTVRKCGRRSLRRLLRERTSKRSAKLVFPNMGVA